MMVEEHGLGHGRRLNDFMAIAAAMLVVALIVLRAAGLFGQSVAAAPLLLAVLAYVVTILRLQWSLLSAAAGLLGAALVGWTLASITDVPWTVDAVAIIWLLVVWMPWPTLENRRSILVMWALAVAPLAMLMMGPPFGDLSWAEPLLAGERIEGNVGFNEIGIPAGLALLAALALRLDRDTWVRYGWQTIALGLAAAAGTRVVLPALLVAGVLWIPTSRSLNRWRDWVVESAPWVLYLVLAARPLFLRTAEGLETGLDEASSGRLNILSEYWAHAQTALLTGRGWGTTEQLLIERQVDVRFLPHNGFMTLVIDVGIPAMLVALVGLTVFVIVRAREVDGAARWLLRVPLLVMLPALFLLDHGLVKAFLTVPIMLFAAAAPWLSRNISVDAGSASTATDLGHLGPRAHDATEATSRTDAPS